MGRKKLSSFLVKLSYIKYHSISEVIIFMIIFKEWNRKGLVGFCEVVVYHSISEVIIAIIIIIFKEWERKGLICLILKLS